MNRTHLLYAAIAASAILASSASAQLDLQWSRTYGTEYNDIARCVTLGNNNDLLIGGWSGAKGGGIPEALRITEEGDSLWTQSYGGGGGIDCPNSIIPCFEGGYAFGGISYRNGGASSRYYYGRLDEQGNLLWEKYYGLSNQIGNGATIIEGDFGDLYLAGTVSIIVQGELDLSDMCLTKVSADGDSLWTRYYGTNVIDNCNRAIRTSNGGFALAGGFYTGSEADHSIPTMAVTDENGEPIWVNRWWQNDIGSALDVAELPDGQFLLVATRYGYENRAIVLIWVSPEGEIVKIVEQPVNITMLPQKMLILGNGDILLCGVTATNQRDNWDVWVARYSPDGEQIWEMTYGGENAEFIYDAMLDPDGGVVMVGEVGPYSDGNMYNSEKLVIRTAPLPLYISKPTDQAMPSNLGIAAVYPNPFNSVTSAVCQIVPNQSATVSLSDLQGRTLKHWTLQSQQAGMTRVQIDGAGLPAGQYRIMLNQNGQVSQAPVVIVK